MFENLQGNSTYSVNLRSAAPILGILVNSRRPCVNVDILPPESDADVIMLQ